MNSIYSWALSFTVCSFVVFVLNFFVPEGGMKRILSLVLVVYTLVSFIPAVNAVNNTNFNTSGLEESEYNENALKENSVSLFKTQLRVLTDSALNEIGINDYELIIDLSMNENKEIVIEEYTIVLDKDSDEQLIKTTVETKTGISPEITVNGRYSDE